MDFGEALREVRDGRKIARNGWNGTDLYVVYQKGYPDGIGVNANTAEATGIPEGTVCAFRPYLMMKVGPQKVSGPDEFVPWVAAQSDLLGDDWYVVST